MSREYGGAIRQLPSGRWQVRIQGPNGRYYPLGVTYQDRSAARLALAAEVKRRDRCLEDGTPWVPPTVQRSRLTTSTVTLRQYADEVIEGRQLKASTLEDYARLRQHFGMLEDMPVDSITADAVIGWWDERDRRRGRTNAKTYVLLRSIFADAIADPRFRLSVNPCMIENAGRARSAPKAPIATVAEVNLIVSMMPDRFRMLVLLGVWCIPRFGETTALRRRDIDLGDNPQVTIARGVQRAGGKWVIDTPKTASGVRIVAIPPHLVPALREHIDKHAAPGKEGLLFPSDSGSFLHESVFYRPWNRARKAAGRPDLRYHDLRGTGATWAGEQGLGLRDLMYRLGQTTPDAALIYLRRSAEADRRAAKGLSTLANPSDKPTSDELLDGLSDANRAALIHMARALRESQGR